jgi:hypothetical protein
MNDLFRFFQYSESPIDEKIEIFVTRFFDDGDGL